MSVTHCQVLVEDGVGGVHDFGLLSLNMCGRRFSDLNRDDSELVRGLQVALFKRRLLREFVDSLN